MHLQQARNSAKFSEKELENLKKEFQHHKEKIHEYNILMDTVSRTEGESLRRARRFMRLSAGYLSPWFPFMLTAKLRL